VWSWWQEGSVHRAAWPDPREALAVTDGGEDGALAAASGVIGAIRAAKSGARVSMRTPVRSLVVAARRDYLDTLTAVLPDLQAAGRVEHTELRVGDQSEPAVEVIL
jgi:valyl-tRNA synthetase